MDLESDTLTDDATDFLAAGVQVGDALYCYISNPNGPGYGMIKFPMANSIKAVSQHSVQMQTGAKFNRFPYEEDDSHKDDEPPVLHLPAVGESRNGRVSGQQFPHIGIGPSGGTEIED